MLGKTAVIKDRTTTLIEICEGRVRACLVLRVSLKVVLVWFLFLFFFPGYCIFIFRNSSKRRELHATFNMTMDVADGLPFSWPLLPLTSA